MDVGIEWNRWISFPLLNFLEDVTSKNMKSKPSSSTSDSTAKLNIALQNLAEINGKLDVVTISVLR
ncbi:hypothetical protein H5410_061747 [Solanum commersonii]|uniref:Uncharacterized protein n=1 Tax=Solanum commersonii TaxID=4109 RepID=A0A9J5W8R0_SOLCO|nr:hypothetical protein H5410_061747 [Solanum commersonii]